MAKIKISPDAYVETMQELAANIRFIKDKHDVRIAEEDYVEITKAIVELRREIDAIKFE